MAYYTYKCILFTIIGVTSYKLSRHRTLFDVMLCILVHFLCFVCITLVTDDFNIVTTLLLVNSDNVSYVLFSTISFLFDCFGECRLYWVPCLSHVSSCYVYHTSISLSPNPLLPAELSYIT